MAITKQQLSDYFHIHGDFNVYGESQNCLVEHATSALNKLQLWYWIKTFDPNKGFISSCNNNIEKLKNEIKDDDHTGVTFACMMRVLQKISNEIIEGDGPSEICTICLSDEYDKNKISLECGHMFHYNCINDILTNNCKKICPCCRRNTLPTEHVSCL